MSEGELAAHAQKMLADLTDGKGLTIAQIVVLLEHRVSDRTLYRWQKAEGEPQRSADVEALEKLHKQIMGEA